MTAPVTTGRPKRSAASICAVHGQARIVFRLGFAYALCPACDPAAERYVEAWRKADALNRTSLNVPHDLKVRAFNLYVALESNVSVVNMAEAFITELASHLGIPRRKRRTESTTSPTRVSMLKGTTFEIHIDGQRVMAGLPATLVRGGGHDRNRFWHAAYLTQLDQAINFLLTGTGDNPDWEHQDAIFRAPR
jgi:hypothetical protein